MHTSCPCYFYAMIRKLSWLMICALPILAKAQDKTPVSLLLIPYQPEFYLSDAERDIMKESRRTPDEYRAFFRQSLDLKLAAALEGLGTVHSILQDSSASGRGELARFYGTTGYSYADPVGPRIADQKEIRKKEKASPLFSNQQTAPQSITTRGDSRFLQAEVSDTALLARWAARYRSSYIIAINQLEIKTNYNNCIDLAHKIYRREVLVHYSILTPAGKQVRGNYLMEFLPADSNRDNDLVERVFPLIAKQLQEQMAGLLK